MRAGAGAGPHFILCAPLQSGKKRVGYIFPREESYILKLLTSLLIRRYDYIVAGNHYSFRACR